MRPFRLPAHVVVRSVSAAYASCLRENAAIPIDVTAARRQHEAYVATLRALGIPVVAVPSGDDYPDACFVEDTAVICGRHALATRPGAPSRRGEVTEVARALADMCTVHMMAEPATLEGGDVLRVGATLFVGLSSRTNEAGAARLAEVAALDGLTTEVLPVDGGLHLKSACTLVDASTLLYAPGLIGAPALARFAQSVPFARAGLTCLAAPEAVGANVLALGETVLVSAAAPETVRLLEARGHRVVAVDVGEMHKGDGALTCLSLRIPAADAWST